jgi:hypothetical protein
MQLRCLPALLLVAAVSLVGCGKPSKLPGTWAVVLPNKVNGDVTFNKDGSMLMEIANPALPSMKIDIAGTYHESGDTLYMTMKDVSLKNVPAEVKDQVPTMLESMKKPLDIGTEKATEEKWSSDTSFTSTTTDNQTATWTKK